jgi:hypothetical protein
MVGRRHHDASYTFRLLVGRRIAAMIDRDPSILDEARRKVAAMQGMPHADHAFRPWTMILAGPASAVGERLARDDAEGDDVRETMPAFVALDAATMSALAQEARRLFRAQRSDA